MKSIFFYLGLGCLVAGLLGSASAHGYTLNPPARQYLCAEAGGNYSPADGSGIPNAACRAAYQVTGSSMLYTQAHEYAINIPDYRNQSAVEASVPDGLLCSGGQERYRGISLASPDWEKTSVPLGGRYTVTFNATVPHDPGFFEVYISKSGFDSSTQKLGWNDVELLGTFENVELNSAGQARTYEMNVDLPSDRTQGESAVLFIRWQRIDTAGEGFYSCSDVVFGAQTGPVTPPTDPVTPPTEPDPDPVDPVTDPDPVDPDPVSPDPSGPEGDLEVRFSTQASWDAGFTGVVTITNLGDALEDWELAFKLKGDATASDSVWGAGGALSREDGGAVVLTPNNWGGAAIGSGETVRIYYGGSGAYAGIEACSINGAACE